MSFAPSKDAEFNEKVTRRSEQKAKVYSLHLCRADVTRKMLLDDAKRKEMRQARADV
jgi:hypothetical protein